MKNPGIGRSSIGLVGVFAGLMAVGTAWAQVPNVTIGTNPAGTVPGYYSQVVKAGGAAAVIEDGCFIAYDIYFGVPSSVTGRATRPSTST